MSYTELEIVKGNMKITQIFALFIISIIVMSCSCPPPNPDDIGVLDSPEKTFEVLRNSIKFDDVKHFYYCLALEIQDKYSYFKVSSGWEEVKKQFEINPDDVKILEAKHLETSPFPEYEAAYIIAEYTNNESKTLRDKLLFLKQPGFDKDGNEIFNWKIYYPFKEYQGVDILTLETTN